MLLYKAVKQRLTTGPPLRDMMDTFRRMVNDCVRLAAELGEPSYLEVKRLCYPRMLEYDIHDSYRISAIYEAANILKKHKKDLKTGHTSRPFVKKPFISASMWVRIEGVSLVMPGMAPIQLNSHTLSTVQQRGAGLVSACLTPASLSIIHKREVAPAEVTGAVALDINLENITSCDDSGRVEVYSLAKVAQLQERYRRTTSRFRRRDARIKQKVFRKYARLRRDRQDWLLHEITSLIAARAAALRQRVAMEDLRGIRKTFRKETRSSAYYLSQMNSWPFAEIQRQVGYKAKGFGLPVVYVGPEGTSSNCSNCGGALRESATGDRMMTCAKCGLAIDRDVNAAKRILSRAMRSVAAGPAGEAMVGGASSGSGTASRVDAGNSGGEGAAGEDQNIASAD